MALKYITMFGWDCCLDCISHEQKYSVPHEHVGSPSTFEAHLAYLLIVPESLASWDYCLGCISHEVERTWSLV